MFYGVLGECTKNGPKVLNYTHPVMDYYNYYERSEDNG